MKKMIALAAFSALAAGSASAMPADQDYAIDKHGQQVFDARGNCVYTMWDPKDGTCGLAITSDMRKVYFDFNSSALKASERKELDMLAKAIKSAKRVESATIVGYADRVGNEGYNQALSQRRAAAVKRYLSSKGIKVKSMDMRGKGETSPVTDCAEDMPHKELVACLAEDRRVDIELNYKK